MKIYHGNVQLKALHWPVATLGTFDGVHRGHQKILETTARLAHDHGGEAIVITFSAHPRSITGRESPDFITSLNHRLLLIGRCGIDITIVLDFDRKLAEMPAAEFARQYFVHSIGAKGVVMGFNNRFGKGGEGDVHLLKKIGNQQGFEVREVGPVMLNDEPVSSTAIRNAISEGRLDDAEKMLGRPVSLLGTVVSGEGRGSKLGFPTANLDLHHETRPPVGLYAAYTTVEGKRYKALVSIGNQPTFHSPEAPVIVEVYLHDFEGDLYGIDLEVIFIEKIRDQQQFESAEELIAAMHRDVEYIQKLEI